MPGIHCWPGARGRRAYLGRRHRHMFHIGVRVSVKHSDRDVEFHDLQDLVRIWWGAGTRELGDLSCEQIAAEIGASLIQQGLAVVSVDVSEDAESGATVQFEVTQ